MSILGNIAEKPLMPNYVGAVETLSLEWSRKSVSITVLKVLGSMLLFAGCTAGTGILMREGGARLISSWSGGASAQAHVLSIVGKTAKYAGENLFLVGKYTFLTIAVPVYVTGWVAPKWIITKGIPQAATFIHTYALIPIYNGIVRATDFLTDVLLKVIRAVYSNVLKPVIRVIAESVKWVWNVVIVPVVDGIIQSVEWIKEAVIHVAQKIYQYILSPVIRVITESVKWVWNVVVVPFVNGIVQSVEWIKEAVIHVAQKIYQYILSPVIRVITEATKWVWNVVVVPVINQIIQSVEWIKEAVIHVSQKIYQYILSPVIRVVAEATQWMWNVAVVPIVSGIIQASVFLKDQVVKLAQAIYNRVISPCERLIVSGLQAMQEHTGKLFTAVVDAGHEAIESVYESFLWITQKGHS